MVVMLVVNIQREMKMKIRCHAKHVNASPTAKSDTHNGIGDVLHTRLIIN